MGKIITATKRSGSLQLNSNVHTANALLLRESFSNAPRSTQEIKAFKAPSRLSEFFRCGQYVIKFEIMVTDSITIQLCNNGIEMFPGCMDREQYRRTSREGPVLGTLLAVNNMANGIVVEIIVELST